MTAADLIAALTLTIAHPNPSPPPDTLAGTASPGDQVPVPRLIAELQNADAFNSAAAARLAGAKTAASSSSMQYTASHAAWVTNQATAFTAWDRGLRALETLILAANPSAPVNPAVHIMTGDIPGAVQRSDSSRVLAKSLNVSPEAIRGERSDQDVYFNALRGEPQPDGQMANAVQIAQSQASVAAEALDQVMARAQKYLDYLAVT
jgi:hypothetical protein